MLFSKIISTMVRLAGTAKLQQQKACLSKVPDITGLRKYVLSAVITFKVHLLTVLTIKQIKNENVVGVYPQRRHNKNNHNK